MPREPSDRPPAEAKTEQRIERLERTLGTLIGWLCYGALDLRATEVLMDMLNAPAREKEPSNG